MKEFCLFCKNSKDVQMSKIWSFKFWQLDHAYHTSQSFWLLLILKRHLSNLHGLESFEWLELSSIFPLISKGLHEITGCKKEYVFQIAEGENYDHVHFHIVPISKEMDNSFLGINIFKFLGCNVNNKLNENEIKSNIKLFYQFIDCNYENRHYK